ncbi:heavy metal translocating P-type ATPase [Brucella ceti TE28753-12]|nr:heavy metal translocating P-type ATPase [Brucella ceti TE28753-12]
MNKTVKPEAVSFPVPVEGMSCASCVSSVEKAVSRVPGVDKVSVNLATERADVTFKGTPDLPAVIEAIRKAGYDVPAGSVDLAIEGMSCASCVSKVEKALSGVPGVTRASVNLATERAHVELAGQVALSELIKRSKRPVMRHMRWTRPAATPERKRNLKSGMRKRRN